MPCHKVFVLAQGRCTTYSCGKLLFMHCQSARPTQLPVHGVAGPEGQTVLLITLPRFSSSATLVLVNLRTLALHPILFDAAIGS